MSIEHDKPNSRFVALGEDGEQMGFIQYSAPTPGEYCATHTVVLPAFEGQGVAGQLLEALAAYIRSQRGKLVLVCTYVAAAVKRHPQRYRDLL